jgi:hypothetical protein
MADIDFELRKLIKNWLLGYLATAEKKKPDVIYVLANIVNMTEDEWAKVGFHSNIDELSYRWRILLGPNAKVRLAFWVVAKITTQPSCWRCMFCIEKLYKALIRVCTLC